MTYHPGKMYAKVLLFGEYSLIVGSKALTIPFRKYSGSFHFFPTTPSAVATEHVSPNDDASLVNASGHTAHLPEQYVREEIHAKASRMSLQAYLDYLMRRPANDGLPGSYGLGSDPGGSFYNILDLHACKEDLADGMYFKSDIPGGSGLGSSGALVAAVYGRYAHEKIIPATASDFQQLTSILAAMESWFHGTSSGIDPLSCYLNTGLQLDTGMRKTFKTITAFPPLTGTFFLVDSGIIRKTGPLVQAFLKKMESPRFRRFMDRQYIPANNACIAAIMEGDEPSLEKNIRSISELQMHHFREMIPTELLDMWNNGLMSGNYSLKLCGSGGGGFLLGYTCNADGLKHSFNNYNCLKLPLP